MVFRIAIYCILLLFVTDVVGQTRTLTGKVIDDSFRPFPQVWISNADTVLLAKTDMDGNFRINIPLDTKTLIVATVGVEWKIIDVSNSCNNLEIILLPRGTYDFMTPGRVDRRRKRQFATLPTLHRSAFKKGIFKSEEHCYIEKFIPVKIRLKEIHRNRTQSLNRQTPKNKRPHCFS